MRKKKIKEDNEKKDLLRDGRKLLDLADATIDLPFTKKILEHLTMENLNH